MGVKTNDPQVLSSGELSKNQPPTNIIHYHHNHNNETMSSTSIMSSSSSEGNKTHLVRINVLGLAGITADRHRCRVPKGKKKNKKYPSPPEDMCAVVAVARDDHRKGVTGLKGTTGLSKPLSKTPSKDVVISSSASNGSNDGDSQTLSTRTSVSSTQRHIAVWSSGRDGGGGSSSSPPIGNVVSFKEELKKMDRSACDDSKSRKSNNPNSTEYAPKTFKLIVALTENSNHENKVAIPFGVANLNICGDNSPEGRTQVLDIPLLSLQQAKPLSDYANGIGDFNMIAVRSENNKMNDVPSSSKKLGKRNPFKRLLGMEGFQKVPTVAQRKAFSEAYSADATGDAILRIQLQVVSLEAAAGDRRNNKTASQLDQTVVDHGVVKPHSYIPEITSFPLDQPAEDITDSQSYEETVKTDQEETVTTDQCDEDDADDDNESQDSLDSLLDGSETFLSYDGTGTLTGTIVSEGTGTLVSEGTGTLASGEETKNNAPSPDVITGGERSADSSKMATSTKTLESSAEPAAAVTTPDAAAPPPELPKAESDENKGEVKKDDSASAFQVLSTIFSAEDDYTLSFEKRPKLERKNRMGLAALRKYIPNCSTPNFGKDIEALDALLDDEITMVTADFFGKDVNVPICAAMKPDDYDDDETMTFQSLDMNQTMSTYTDLDRDYMAKHFRKSSKKKRNTERKKKAMEEIKDDRSFVNVKVQKGSSGEESDEVETIIRDLQDLDQIQEATFSESLSKLFGCGPSVVEDLLPGVGMDGGVPTGVVIRDGDNESVGELTALTYERKTKVKPPQKSKKPHSEQEQQQKHRDSDMFPLPVACGGNGIFTKRKVTLVQKNDPIERLMVAEKKNANGENIDLGVELHQDYSVTDSGARNSSRDSHSKRSEDIVLGVDLHDEDYYDGGDPDDDDGYASV